MIKQLRQLIKQENGQVMIAALVYLALCGLIITPIVSYADTTAQSSTLKKASTQGLYAADAGIEYVLFSIKKEYEIPSSLSENINGMSVTMDTVNKDEYTLVAGEWVVIGGPHSADLTVSTSIDWDVDHNAYKYTITCTWFEPDPGLVKLIEVGARLPLDFEYEEDSAAIFGDNLSTSEPLLDPDSQGASMLRWSLPSISIEDRTQVFYITDSGEPGSSYGWACASRQDVGDVGELTGTFYIITATATNPQTGKVTGKIAADVMKNAYGLYIISWRVLK
ncbi:hypothetical protein ACFLXC_03430 [Chloroflexota bacterium]